jgi:hypothetical protein
MSERSAFSRRSFFALSAGAAVAPLFGTIIGSASKAAARLDPGLPGCEMLVSRSFSIEEIARCWRVPPSKLGVAA